MNANVVAGRLDAVWVTPHTQRITRESLDRYLVVPERKEK